MKDAATQKLGVAWEQTSGLATQAQDTVRSTHAAYAPKLASGWTWFKENLALVALRTTGIVASGMGALFATHRVEAVRNVLYPESESPILYWMKIGAVFTGAAVLLDFICRKGYNHFHKPNEEEMRVNKGLDDAAAPLPIIPLVAPTHRRHKSSSKHDLRDLPPSAEGLHCRRVHKDEEKHASAPLVTNMPRASTSSSSGKGRCIMM
jgi:hypothetical protein